MARDLLLSRRELLALGGYGMVAVSLPGVTGCGGGGGSKASGPGPTGFEGNGSAAAGSPGAPVSAAQRAAALDAIAAAIAPAAAGALRFDATALARRLQAMTSLQRVGISTATQNVWALFTDGRALVVPNNLDPAGPATALGALADPAPRALAGVQPRVAAAAREPLPALLTLGQYRQLDMFGEVPISAAADAAHLCLDSVGASTLPRLRTLAVGRGFVLPASQTTSPPDQGHDNGVPGLQGVAGDGVFFLTGCGAEVGADAARKTVICVDTAATDANLALYEAELAAGLLTYAVSMRGVAGQWTPFKCLALTPAFAAGRWSFPVESLAILNLAGGSVLADWGAALSACGLKNVLTWDRPVSWRRMLAFADDLIQLLLATNDLRGSVVRQGIEPRLRAYGVGETLSYLGRRHLTDDADGVGQAAYLKALPAAEQVNTLLPTIDYVNIDEGAGVIELNGQFGAKQGAVAEARWALAAPAPFSEALLDRAADGPLPGTDALPDPAWYGDLIQSAPGSQALLRGGYIQVLNGGRCSNAVQITHWEIPLHVVSTIAGGLTLDVTVTLHLRADVRGHRMAPDGPRGGANRFTFALASTPESRADYVASGEIARTLNGETTTVTWSGSGAVTNAPGAMRVSGGGQLDWTGRRLTPFTLAAVGGPTYDQRTVVTRGLEVVSDTIQPRSMDVTAVLTAAGALLELVFGAGWVLQAGSVELASEAVDLLGPRTRTTALSWAAVTPHFPPEATVGGV